MAVFNKKIDVNLIPEYTLYETMDTLARENPHQRDEHISFDEPTHTYTIDGDSSYTSVTTWNHSHFEEFDADKVIAGMMARPNCLITSTMVRRRKRLKLDGKRTELLRQMQELRCTTISNVITTDCL